MRLPDLMSRVFDTPLLIEPAKAETIVESVILPKIWGHVFEAREPSAAPSLEYAKEIAVLPIHGTLVHRTGGMDAMSGLQSYQEIRGMLRQAMADPMVGGILLDIDSPGGEVAGLPDLAQELIEARQIKPIYAIANEKAGSAAYWLASAAEKLFVTQTAAVGSIGVMVVHADRSAMNEKIGVKYTPVYAGSRKLEGSPNEPLSDEAKDRLQADVDRVYEMFVSAVAQNRAHAFGGKLDADAVRATEAGVFYGKQAKDAKLADEVGTFDSAAAALAKRLATARSGAARSRATVGSRAEMMDQHAQTGAPAAGVESVETTASVVNLDEVRAQAKREGAAEAKAATEARLKAEFAARAEEIAEMCTLARVPHLAGKYIAATDESGELKPTAVIRKELVNAQATVAEETHVSTQHAAGPVKAQAKPINHQAIYEARAKACGQSH
ncbi:MAG: peptidase family protein [Microvirga sp.]|jgi:signal peptide peptidase SppA|nr:peptidase family protein [Microvirga sp.]MCD6071721.1 peptidase family protein [Microvirga sp.]MDF2970726.1 peptidase family protein [Microvirga sp.]